MILGVQRGPYHSVKKKMQVYLSGTTRRGAARERPHLRLQHTNFARPRLVTETREERGGGAWPTTARVWGLPVSSEGEWGEESKLCRDG